MGSTNMTSIANGSADNAEGEQSEQSEDGGSENGPNGKPQKNLYMADVVLDVETPAVPGQKSQSQNRKSDNTGKLKVKRAAMRYEAAMRRAADDRVVMGSITIGGDEEVGGIDTTKGIEHDDIDDIENEVQLQQSEVGAKERAVSAEAEAVDEDAELMEAVETMGAPDVCDEDEDDDDAERLLKNIASDDFDDEYKTPLQPQPNMELYKVSTTHASIEDMFDHVEVRATAKDSTRMSYSKEMEPGSPRMHYKASSTHNLEDMFDVQEQVVTATETTTTGNKASESTAQGRV